MTGRALGITPLLVLAISSSAGGTGEIERLAWMTGCWEFTAGQRTVEEQWMAPRGNSMMGMSRTVRSGRLVAWETAVLREDSTGAITYNAFPGGQPPAVFPAVETSDSHAVFSNPAHDFPQRVIYRRRGDTLAARVEGTVDGTVRGSDFPYLRTGCPGRGVAGVTDGQGFTE